MSIVSMFSHQALGEWIDKYLEEISIDTTPVTWLNYSWSIDLWRTFLAAYYGRIALNELAWEHIEGFVAYWYFRYYENKKYNDALVMLLSLENFHNWLVEQGIILKSIWHEENSRKLKEDFNRYLSYTQMRSEVLTDEIVRLTRSLTWYEVVEIGEKEAVLKDMVTKNIISPTLSKKVKRFLHVGDICMGTVWWDKKRKAYLDEYGIRSFYPALAKRYFVLYNYKKQF